MLDFILCESYMKRATKHERMAVMLQVCPFIFQGLMPIQLQFWGELSQQNPDLQKLFLLGSSVNAQVTQTGTTSHLNRDSFNRLLDQYFSKALHSNAKSSNVLRSYARFLLV